MLLHLLSKNGCFWVQWEQEKPRENESCRENQWCGKCHGMTWYGREQKKLMLLEGPGVLLLARSRPSKSCIGQTGDGTWCFWRDKAVCCRTGWLVWIQARNAVSSGGIRVRKLHVVAFLLWPDGLHGVHLSLARPANQRESCVEDLWISGSPVVEFTWSLP